MILSSVRGGGNRRISWPQRRKENGPHLGVLLPLRITASWFGSAAGPPNKHASATVALTGGAFVSYVRPRWTPVPSPGPRDRFE
jgi:hypothetical protein